MLVKYPGLTLVGGLAMAFTIWVGAGTFEFVSQVVAPTLPLPEGDRIVALQNRDAARNRVDPRALHDFVGWRTELRMVEELAAYRTLERNLITADGLAEPVEVAEISASAFRLVRVPPMLGRGLVEADERAGAPSVAVIGYRPWQTRFGGDPAVVGRTVRLGNAYTTIVGVMPEGFGFPVAQGLWVPLRLDPLAFDHGHGPAISVFGRLAPGATLDEAGAELATVGRRASADFPLTHEHLRPQVLPYAQAVLGLSTVELLMVQSGNLFLVLLLVLICGNVALLMLARAATREIGIRIALGSDRRRIVAALFARPLTQVTIGVVVGAALIAAMLLAATGGSISPRAGAMLVGYTLFMFAVCMLACVVPTRRALRIEPTEALRAEG